MRAVLDTNTIVSGLNVPGREREDLTLARGQYELYRSPSILAEVAGVVGRKFGWGAHDVRRAVAALRGFASVVDPEPALAVVPHDADHRILECAVAAGPPVS